MTRFFLVSLGLAAFFGGPVARAESPPRPDAIRRANEAPMDKYAYLRTLTLDLAGTVPSMDAYRALVTVADVPEATIDRLLADEAFVARTVRRHRAILWNNIDNVVLTDYRASFTRTRSAGGNLLYWRRRVAVDYRGDTVPCDDVPATFDRAGKIAFRVDENGLRREGYVAVAPYWDPETPIRVCAYDAQERARSPAGTDCASPAGFRDAFCGCGPNLRLCRNRAPGAITRGFAQDVERRVAQLVREGRPYRQLFTGRTAFVNGPVVHFLKYQAGIPAAVPMTPLAYDPAALPDIPFVDADTYQEIELGPEHAGILTSPAYLLRFPTNRARATRFYDAFLCQPFRAPPGGVADPEPKTSPHPDLQERDGCKHCHARLEPAAAHWGRWVQSGAGFLSPAAFPARRADCRACASSGRACRPDCALHYITRTAPGFDARTLGALRAYGFLKDPHHAHVERGPKLLAARTMVGERFPECTARRALEGMFGRELTADEEPWLKPFARRFVASDYDYRALVKAIVMSPVYRRARR